MGLLAWLQGSSLFGQRILQRPLEFNNPHRNIQLESTAYSQMSDSPWFVIAIDDRVQSSREPGGRQNYRKLSFGELYWAVEEDGSYLKIVKDDRRDNFDISSRAENYGWVHKNDLLLWQNCLKNRETQISLKGMILNTTRALTSGDANYSRIQSFKDPDMNIPSQFEARLFEIFYIYRYSANNNSVLLGRSPFFSARDQTHDASTGNIIGWVDINRVLEWDHRVAIEPSWESAAVEERYSRQIKSTVFDAGNNMNERCANEFSSGRVSAGCNITWEDDLWDESGNFERKPGYWRRFPVIGDMGANVYKLMVMGELTGEGGRTVIREDIDVKVRQTLNQLIEKTRNINVVFVIDGTTSMGPYYESVINSVQRIVRIFEMSGEEYKDLKFGYVVYRDYLEKDRLLETRQLTSNSSAVINQLRNVEAIDFYDVHAHEAVYYGLKAALTQVFQDSNETNVMIHIGDAGNHYRNDPSQVPQSEIVDLIAEMKCYYIAFQVHHMRDHQAYIDFPHQIREIMSRSGDRMYQQWVDLMGEGIVGEKPVLRRMGHNIHRIENGPPMVVMASDMGQQMDLVYLEDEITQAIEEIDEYTDNVVEKAREMLERGQGIEVITGETQGKYASSFAPGVYNFLLRTGLDEDIIEQYYSKNIQFVTEGYAARHHQSLNRPLFEPVLLLEAIEFSRILLRVQQLRQAGAVPGDRRERLYDTWIELLKRHVGVKPESYFQELTLEEASSMVFGIPLKSGMLQHIQLRYLFDEAVFSDNALSRYVNQIDFKYRELERIANMRDYPYSFISNDILYYWIHVDLLP